MYSTEQIIVKVLGFLWSHSKQRLKSKLYTNEYRWLSKLYEMMQLKKIIGNQIDLHFDDIERNDQDSLNEQKTVQCAQLNMFYECCDSHTTEYVYNMTTHCIQNLCITLSGEIVDYRVILMHLQEKSGNVNFNEFIAKTGDMLEEHIDEVINNLQYLETCLTLNNAKSVVQNMCRDNFVRINQLGKGGY